MNWFSVNTIKPIWLPTAKSLYSNTACNAFTNSRSQLAWRELIDIFKRFSFCVTTVWLVVPTSVEGVTMFSWKAIFLFSNKFRVFFFSLNFLLLFLLLQQQNSCEKMKKYLEILPSCLNNLQLPANIIKPFYYKRNEWKTENKNFFETHFRNFIVTVVVLLDIIIVIVIYISFLVKVIESMKWKLKRSVCNFVRETLG